MLEDVRTMMYRMRNISAQDPTATPMAAPRTVSIGALMLSSIAATGHTVRRSSHMFAVSSKRQVADAAPEESV